jgi:NAD(P)-dependent dehydrogenase (short-subunit alcohol dehydrogenase family)
MTSPADLFDLDGKVAIVTGASSGLGWQFALSLARAGAKVALAARRVERLGELARQIESFDGRAIPIALDVTDPQSIADCVATAETELGPVSILVNNAGVAERGHVLEHSKEAWDRAISVNLDGVWLMAQETARHIARLGHGGTIINIASVLGLVARPQLVSYCASKAAVVNLTRAMALDLAQHDIRVNAIAPGYIETDINREFLRSEPGQAMIAEIPQRRVGNPEDLDGALLLLASDASRFMTGSVIVVDGGHMAGL